MVNTYKKHIVGSIKANQIMKRLTCLFLTNLPTNISCVHSYRLEYDKCNCLGGWIGLHHALTANPIILKFAWTHSSQTQMSYRPGAVWKYCIDSKLLAFYLFNFEMFEMSTKTELLNKVIENFLLYCLSVARLN